MSGLETAGIVLGTIPLVISAIQAYYDMMKKWRSIRRDLASLSRRLETEKLKLSNVIERLLVGITDQLPDMLKDPFGRLWKEERFQQRLRVRLGNALSNFEHTINQINLAIDELKLKLMLTNQGQLPSSEKATLKRILQQKRQQASFLFRKATYDDLLTQIQDDVTILENIVPGNILLEPVRRYRSRNKLSQTVRSLYKSTHEALRCSFRCEGLHNVSLRLMPLSAELIDGDINDDFLQSLSLQLVISSHIDQGQEAKHWEEIFLRQTIEQKTASPTAITTHISKKGVKFLETTTNIRQSGSTAQYCTVSAPRLPSSAGMGVNLARDIDDLCQVVHKSAKRKAEACYGRITDSTSLKKYSIYSVYNMNELGDFSWKLISLTDVVKNSEGKFPPLLDTDKYRLAWIIASNVVQLHNTPWVPDTLRLGDIFFIQRPNKTLFEDIFVWQKLPNGTAPHAAVNQSIVAVQNQTLLALGIMLVELILGPIIAKESSSISFHEFDEAQRLLPKVRFEAGLNYGSAVQRCFVPDSHQQSRSLEDEGFRKDVFGGIIALLEEDMNNSVRYVV